MKQYIAFLRGINVGGRNKVSMEDLSGIFRDSGAEQVQTYIQSGNVLFNADPSAATAIQKRVQAAMLKVVNNSIPVILRTVEELQGVYEGNPFLPQVEESELYVLFLDHEPSQDRLAELDPDRSSSDEYEVKGREFYLRLPNGVGRTKLNNAYFDRVLEATGTMRNWRTIGKLLKIAGDRA